MHLYEEVIGLTPPVNASWPLPLRVTVTKPPDIPSR
jgi:hypothetical protein